MLAPLRLTRRTVLGQRACSWVAGHAASLSTRPYPGLARPFAASYDPEAVESETYGWWESQECFRDGARGAAAGGTFSMVIPPPNVTGELHVGHALTVTLQDILVRWRKMMGERVVWVPGVDHAGIATQAVVERHLLREHNMDRREIGRDRFTKEVWQWYEQYNHRIDEQLKRLGASLTWDKKAFTMDGARREAVVEAFVRLFDKGLIYRSTRLVNWCPALETVISDLEVEYQDIAGKRMIDLPSGRKVEVGVMHDFAYSVEGGGEIVVSTTRLETMLGDVAIAIHPEDGRYEQFHGKFAVHPFRKGQKLPIVLDADLVDMQTGTGAVKITPAHDPSDFECGLRHELPSMNIFYPDGTLRPECGSEWHRVDRFEARSRLVKALDGLGLYRGKREHAMRLGLCSRSGDVIEPMLMPQWFLRCDDMASRALRCVQEGDVKINPSWHEKTWNHFLQNIQPWCISRQLWWGHRIPAFQVVPKAGSEKKERWVAAHSYEAAVAKAKERFGVSLTGGLDDEYLLQQDEDVLDTWFSSALFPLATLGWPAKLDRDLYPLNLMETGSDILFFWVARMMFLCPELCEGGELPFREILLHPLVRDKQGRKMSKSLGNVIDPTHVVEGVSLSELQGALHRGNLPEQERKRAASAIAKELPGGIPQCGADALRLALASYMHHGTTINLDVHRVVKWRHFCNKMWNAVSFAVSREITPRQSGQPEPEQEIGGVPSIFSVAYRMPDAWVLTKLSRCVDQCNKALEQREFAKFTKVAQEFFVKDFCDVYIEICKTKVDRRTLETLAMCLDTYLRLMHPVAPFVTEELWHRVRSSPLGEYLEDKEVEDNAPLVDAPYPQDLKSRACSLSEECVDFVLDIVRGIRGLRSPLSGVLDSEVLRNCVQVVYTEDESAGMLTTPEALAFRSEDCTRVLHHLSGAFALEVTDPGLAGTSVPYLSYSVRPNVEVRLLLEISQGDKNKLSAEALRLEQKLKKLSVARSKLSLRVHSASYKSKAPTKIQARDSQTVSDYDAEMETMRKTLATLEGLIEKCEK